jgi:hypothetical protein
VIIPSYPAPGDRKLRSNRFQTVIGVYRRRFRLREITDAELGAVTVGFEFLNA